jgi:hypothetical protein
LEPFDYSPESLHFCREIIDAAHKKDLQPDLSGKLTSEVLETGDDLL